MRGARIRTQAPQLVSSVSAATTRIRQQTSVDSVPLAVQQKIQWPRLLLRQMRVKDGDSPLTTHSPAYSPAHSLGTPFLDPILRPAVAASATVTAIPVHEKRPGIRDTSAPACSDILCTPCGSGFHPRRSPRIAGGQRQTPSNKRDREKCQHLDLGS